MDTDFLRLEVKVEAEARIARMALQAPSESRKGRGRALLGNAVTGLRSGFANVLKRGEGSSKDFFIR